MACFTVTVAEAIITTVATKIIEKKEKKEALKIQTDDIERKPGFSRKLKWLNNLLWGGSALLAFEHIWHGEVVPWFPFLTAMNDPADTAEMLHEMATVGVAMAALVTAVWAGIVVVSNILEKRAKKSAPEKSALPAEK